MLDIIANVIAEFIPDYGRARAVLTALRDPTPNMLLAIRDDEQARAGWNAAIDAALGDE